MDRASSSGVHDRILLASSMLSHRAAAVFSRYFDSTSGPVERPFSRRMRDVTSRQGQRAVNDKESQLLPLSRKNHAVRVWSWQFGFFTVELSCRDFVPCTGTSQLSLKTMTNRFPNLAARVQISLPCASFLVGAGFAALVLRDARFG